MPPLFCDLLSDSLKYDYRSYFVFFVPDFQPTDSKTEKKDTDKRVGLTELLRMSAPDWLPLSIAFVCLSIAAVAQAFIPHLTGN
jgi:hypothetical protein